ncbi:MAG: hypothetical protein ABIG44_08565, partial [Planctomycetota bacterium]
LLTCGTVQALDWVELGPAPIVNGHHTGRVSAIACSPTDPALYFVAGADGGVWRTVDGGTSWTPVTQFLPTTAIGALAVDPTNEAIIYAGTGEANYANHSRFGEGVYKSSDGGDTWEVLASDVFAGRCFSKLIIDPTNPLRLYASITRAGGFPELAAAKGHPNATGSLGVFRSEDGGVSWTHLTNGLPALSATDLSIDVNTPATLFAGIGRIFGSPDNGIYRSTDGGDSWTKLAGGLPDTELGRISVAVAPSLSTRVYAMLTHQSNESGGEAYLIGAYRSDDGGDTWTEIPLSSSIQATYGWYLSVIGVHPSNADLVFMGGVTLWRSTNAGANWSNVTTPHVDMHAVTWDASGRLVVGDDGGVHRSTDSGSSWTTHNEGLGVIQCYAGLSTHPTDDKIMFVGVQDNGTCRRIPTEYWILALGGDGGWTQLDQNNPAYVFAEFQGTGNLYRSTIGGGSFTQSSTGIDVNDRNCFLPPYLIDPANSNRMLYATHRIYISNNRGSSWTPYSDDLTGGGSAAIRALAIAPSDSNIVYAATNDGRILRSDDGGQNFVLIAENVPGWPRVTRELFVHPTDPLTVYQAVASFGETQIRRTSDGGQSWEALDANFPDMPVNVLAVDVRGRHPVIYVGAEVGLYRSIDDGESWHRLGTGLPNTPVIDLRLQPARGRLIACTQGRGVWTLAVGMLGDMNGDGYPNAYDIDPFLLAIGDPDAYDEQYPELDRVVQGDMNGDGLVNSYDIDGFIRIIGY